MPPTSSNNSLLLSASLVAAEELASGLAALNKLIQDVGAKPQDKNEADTRFQIIDRLLVECLGCPRPLIKCERLSSSEYTDYEVGSPLLAIWEAKREGKVFEMPAEVKKKAVQKLESLAAISSDTKAAILQANEYCRDRGCEVAVVTNGHQIIAFLASDFSLSLTGNAYVVRSLKDLESNFGRVWQLLSYPALRDGHLRDFLQRSTMSRPPEKLSSYIPNYPQFKNRSDLQSSLRTIADLLLLDIEKQETLEESFYNECYVTSGGLSQNSTVSKSILAARYASLFGDDEENPSISTIQTKKGKDTFKPDLLAEAISSRPIILLGDVGVGKSSFIKHLKYVSSHEEFKHAIYINIDLGISGALSNSLKKLVLDSVEKTLLEEHDIDIQENEFVRRVYKKQLTRFARSANGSLMEIDPTRFLLAEIEYLNNLTGDTPEHIKNCVQYLAKEKRKQLIIAIDNADQRSSDVQQEAFLVAQNIASTWKAAVFVSMRPSTFYTSKRAGALAAYQSRVFTIPPPRVDLVLEKRLRFALEIAEGKRQLETLQNVGLELNSIVAILNAIIPSIKSSDEVQIFLENITAGNIRVVIEFLAELIGSPNIDTEALIRGLAENDEFFIPLHDFWKVALKGEFEFFDPSKVRSVNVFDTYSNDPSEHFLAPLLLAYLAAEGSHRASEGFVKNDTLVNELQGLGFSLKSIQSCVRRLINDRLVDSSLRISFEEDELGLYGTLPEKMRINTTGAYYINKWIATFSYLDAVAVDTQIFHSDVKESILERIRSTLLTDRAERAELLRDYLSEVWSSLGIAVSYFDWDGILRAQSWTFEKVAGAMARRRGF
jgi:GTPase SAR1 family protein